MFTSGGTEAIHLALLGAAAPLAPGRLLLSAVEHPATVAAAARLEEQGWHVQSVPVDRAGRLDLAVFEALLEPPTRLVSIIWGQSEVGTVQAIEPIGARCREAGVPLHVDAVQLVGHRLFGFDQLPIDLLSCAAHKLQGPRGVGALLVRPGLPFAAPTCGGGQEGGRRGGTEPVPLVAGFATALEFRPSSGCASMKARTRWPPCAINCWISCCGSPGWSSPVSIPARRQSSGCPTTSACWRAAAAVSPCRAGSWCGPSGATGPGHQQRLGLQQWIHGGRVGGQPGAAGDGLLRRGGRRRRAAEPGTLA